MSGCAAPAPTSRSTSAPKPRAPKYTQVRAPVKGPGGDPGLGARRRGGDGVRPPWGLSRGGSGGGLFFDFEEDFEEGDFYEFSDGDCSDSFDFVESDVSLNEVSDLPIADAPVELKVRECECLTPDMILERQQSAISVVRGILEHLPISSVRVLLQSFQWDANKMLARFTEDPDGVLEEAGLPATALEPGTRALGVNECPICFDDEDLVALHCGHAFCKDCWRQYLTIQVKERKTLLCCGRDGDTKCQAVVDEFTVMSLVEDEDCRNIYKRSLTDSFVEDNIDCKWCPAPGCENAILLHERSGEKNDMVQCYCGLQFCFHCLSTDHRPCSCAMVIRWKKLNKGEDTSLDESFVATFTRPCPRCKVPIQKNSGCNHMNCIKCNFHFCWHCMRQFGGGKNGGNDGYSSHKCNDTYQTDDESQSKHAEVKKFRFFSERFESHRKSALLEEKMLAMSLPVAAHLKKEGFLSDDFTPAVKQILINRRILQWSYAFGYYRPDYVNKGIFENLQLDVERHTEKLSQDTQILGEMVVNGTDQADGVVTQRQEVVNQRRIAQKVLAALLDSSSHWSLLLSQHGDDEEAVTQKNGNENVASVKGSSTKTTEDTKRRPRKSSKEKIKSSPYVASAEEEKKPRKGLFKRLRKRKASG